MASTEWVPQWPHNCLTPDHHRENIVIIYSKNSSTSVKVVLLYTDRKLIFFTMMQQINKVDKRQSEGVSSIMNATLTFFFFFLIKDRISNLS